MFRGVNAITLDAKGRLSVPAKYRDALMQSCNGHLVITLDTEDACLLMYPAEEWAVIEAQVDRLPSLDPVARRIKRLLIGHATDVEMDANGRILLPAILRELINLDKKCMMVGQRKKFELWSETTWCETRDDYLEDTGSNPELSEQLRQLAL